MPWTSHTLNRTVRGNAQLHRTAGSTLGKCPQKRTDRIAQLRPVRLPIKFKIFEYGGHGVPIDVTFGHVGTIRPAPEAAGSRSGSREDDRTGHSCLRCSFV